MNDKREWLDEISGKLERLLKIEIWITPMVKFKYSDSVREVSYEEADWIILKLKGNTDRKYKITKDHDIYFNKMLLGNASVPDEIVKLISDHYSKLSNMRLERSVANGLDKGKIGLYLIKKIKDALMNDQKVCEINIETHEDSDSIKFVYYCDLPNSGHYHVDVYITITTNGKLSVRTSQEPQAELDLCVADPKFDLDKTILTKLKNVLEFSRNFDAFFLAALNKEE